MEENLIFPHFIKNYLENQKLKRVQLKDALFKMVQREEAAQ